MQSFVEVSVYLCPYFVSQYHKGEHAAYFIEGSNTHSESAQIGVEWRSTTYTSSLNCTRTHLPHTTLYSFNTYEKPCDEVL